MAVLFDHLHYMFFPTMAMWPDVSSGFVAELLHPLRALFSVVYNGQFAVMLFWIMSAFVLSSQYFLRKNLSGGAIAHNYLEHAVVRRYPRLFLPVLVSVLVCYVLFANGLMYNKQLSEVIGGSAAGWISSWYAFSPGFLDALYSASWQTFFDYDRAHTYNVVLWTMEKEFYGSLFLFAFLALFGESKARFLAYPIMACVIGAFHLTWLNSFLAGILVGDVFVNSERGKWLDTLFSWSFVKRIGRSRIFAVAGWLAVFGGVGFFQSGGMLLVFGFLSIGLLMLSKVSQEFLGGKIPVFFGRVSLGLYLFHWPILCSMGCAIYLSLVESLGMLWAAILASVATCIVSILVGYYFDRFIDSRVLKISRCISDRIVGSKK